MFCGARTRNGGRCRRYPLAGKRRCRLHGGKSTGPTTAAGVARALASLVAGRGRGGGRMWEGQAEGLVGKVPGGRLPKALAQKRDGDVISRARAIVVQERAELPIEPALLWEDQSHAQKLSTLTGQVLDKVREILETPCELDNLKLLSIQKDAALSVLSTQVRIDQSQLRHRENEE